jgi:SAM-dependent methyltransferase
MTPSDVWDEDAASSYDRDAADMFSPSVLDPTVDYLERLARPHGALEFAIGTGRVAIPLAARGIHVTGIELSGSMVHQLRQKVDEATLPVVVGDMSTQVAPGTFSLVYLVFNTISNLTTQAEQVRCFQNAARHLASGGHFVIELWVPPLRRLPPGQTSVPFEVSEGHLGFDTYDTVQQSCTSHHYHRDQDGTVRFGSRTFRYLWPSECDLMAQLAGMELESRFADWDGSPFTAESEQHISTWRKL